MQKVLSIGALLLVLVGCAADSGWKVAYEQERASRQEQDSRIRNLERNLEAQQRQPPQPQQIPQPQSPQSQQSPPPQWGQIRDQSTPGSPIFKAVQKKQYKALYRALKESPTAPESAVAAGSEWSYIERSVGAP